MAKVTNLTERTAHLHHWRVLPKSAGSKLLDRQDHFRPEMPAEVAYSPEAKLLADNGHLAIEGYVPAPKVETKAPEPAPVQETPSRKKFYKKGEE
jgi:hypothetical protein